MKGLLDDCRHALRLYRHTPGSSLIAVVVLAVGMAFVGAFLSLYVDLALRRYPGFEDGSRLVTIAGVSGTDTYSFQVGPLERMAEEISTLEVVVGFGAVILPVSGGGRSVLIETATEGFFDGIQPKLVLGRGFDRVEHSPEAEPMVVISDRYWQEAFDRRVDVIGEIVELQVSTQRQEESRTAAFRVVGVMAPEVQGVMYPGVDFWMPLERLLPVLYGGNVDLEQRRVDAFVKTVGRLRPGASVRALVGELDLYHSQNMPFGESAGIDAVSGLVPEIAQQRETTRQLRLFLAGSVLLALVAAANASLFLLARAPGRRRELAIRLAVGAPFGRLARQLASEAALLVAAASALGLLLSVWLANVLRGMAFLRYVDWNDVTLLDWKVLGLAALFVSILCVLVSLAPTMGLKRIGLAASGRQVAARATHAQRIAGNLQIAVAGMLGGAAVAFAWFLAPVVFGEPGYEIRDRHSVLFVHRSMFGATGNATTREIEATRLREAILALPGVNALSLTFLVPASAPIETRTIRDPADSLREIAIGYGRIDENFVDVLGLRLLYGRSPAANEFGVSLVNRTLARQLFDRDNVVGEILDAASVVPGGLSADIARPTEIVGVLEDLSFAHPAEKTKPILFMNLPPGPLNFQSAIVDSALNSTELQRQLQLLYDSGTTDLQPNVVRPIGDFRNSLVAPDAARGLLTILTASLVMLLAALGFYGTQRYLVGAGRREYAIRASLGAGPRSLGRIVFGRGFMLGLPGLALGTLLAFVLVAWLRDDYVSREVSPGYVAATVLIGLTLLLLIASIGPAREARRTQPARLLRED
jgi:predicted permease